MIKPEVMLFKPEEPTVVLTLSIRAAEILQALLENVGGPPQGPRAIADNIYTRLNDMGIYRPSDISVTLRRAGIYIEERK